MQANRISRRRRFLVWLLCLVMTAPSSFAGEGPFFWSRAAEPTPVEQLAKKLDTLEKHIDKTGSIVIKAPDVWGESRLMSHRGDVETQLRARLNTFDVTTNAIQSTREAAFLAGALSLQQQVTGTNQALPTTTADSLIDNPSAASNGNVLPRSGFGRVAATGEVQTATPNVQLEPVVVLDQLNRYLNHLNELRRLNEGDDITDSPGYALNLIRIPVSVLPGRQTERGYGAEVQITVDPYISDEILPLAFRDFVTNGVVNRVSAEVMDIATTIDIQAVRRLLLEHYSGVNAESAGDTTETSPAGPPPISMGSMQVSPISMTQIQPVLTSLPVEDRLFNKLNRVRLNSVYGDAAFISEEERQTLAGELEAKQGILDNAKEALERVKRPDADPSNVAQAKKDVETAEKGVEKTKEKLSLSKLADSMNQVTAYPDTHHRNVSIAQSSYPAVNGVTLYVISLFAYDRLCQRSVIEARSVTTAEVPREARFQNGLTMTALQSLLQREVKAAHQFLEQPSAQSLWSQFCTPDLAQKIREHRREVPSSQLKPLVEGHLNEKVRNQTTEMCPWLPPTTRIDVDPRCGIHTTRAMFFDEIRRLFPQAKGTVTASLAWHIIVESALLNERMNEDMQEIRVLKNCQCMSTDLLDFTGPNPSPMARNQFREYVKCRWPIHVFALDPVTQDQNISDSFSRRREMQMAAAVAASNSLVGGQALMRYARRMEYDLETLELNRTAISFSHGNDTFGWRFYPRVQSPPVSGTLTTAAHDLLLGGPSRDADLLKRKLEPGTRECTALVVMPSFVPQVMVDVRSDWFRLAAHKPILKFMARKPGFQDAMKLSKEVVSLKQLAQRCSSDAHLYRNGEVYRLCKAVERLDHRLPLQTHMIQVPWENTLGGFELLQSGEAALVPDLTGWYGAPGILVADEGLRRSALARVMEARREMNTAELNVSLLSAGISRTEGRGKIAVDALTAATKAVTDANDAYANIVAATNDTTLFLTGKNFSVLNARIIAGGVDVTDSVQVINRSLLSVRIPSNVSTVTIHGQTERTVAVYLATPHGATNRLLIPVHEVQEKSATVSATDDATKAAAAATKAATAATAAVKSVSDRYPVRLSWGASKKDLTFAAHLGSPSQLQRAISFDATTDGSDAATLPIPVVEARAHTPWPFSPPANSDVYADGQLGLWVESQEFLGAKEAVGPWPISNGNINNLASTPAELLTLVLSRIEHKIKASGKPDQVIPLVVTGFVRFGDSTGVLNGSGQPVMRIENKITFNVRYSDFSNQQATP